MRSVWVVLLAILIGACGGSSSDGPPTTPVDGYPLSEFLPASVNGVDTTTRNIDVVSADTPRVFVKTVARLSKSPPDAEMARAYESGNSVYAVRIDGVSGYDILLAFIGEMANVADGSFSPPPTTTVGGKQVMRSGGSATNTFFYSSGDVFYYVETHDEPTAVDVLQQLP